MKSPTQATQFSNRLFTRLSVVLIFAIIIIGSGLEYILNSIDESDNLRFIKQVNQPVFELTTQALLAADEAEWQKVIDAKNEYLDQPLMLILLTDFAADEGTLKQLENGEILALFDINDELTLYHRIGNSQFVLAYESLLPGPEDQRAWVLPVFYFLFALVLYLLIRPFAKQLLQLKQAAIDLGQGDFSARVEVPASTTLAPIADAFNTMTKKIERLLLTQRDLVNAVSHELRTPLARLKFGFEEAAATTDKHTLNQTLSAMKADVSELELLIDEMLRYAEVNQIKVFAKSAVNIKSMIESLVKHHSNGEVKLIAEIDSSLQPDDVIMCHEMSLYRALSNVLRNALSFAQSHCTVSVDRNDNELMVEINDDGVGLSGVDQDRIFEPFYKVASKHRQPGYGLGLAIAHTISKKHHGTLQAVAGQLPGACFRFVIPLS